MTMERVTARSRAVRALAELGASPADADAFAGAVLAGLADGGWEVLRAASVRSARLRQGRAESRAEYAERDAEHSQRWARDCLAQERALRDRLDFVYGAAVRAGASAADLRGCAQCAPPATPDVR